MGGWWPAFPVSVSLPSWGLDVETPSGNSAAQPRRGGRSSPRQAPWRAFLQDCRGAPAPDHHISRAESARRPSVILQTLIATQGVAPELVEGRRRLHSRTQSRTCGSATSPPACEPPAPGRAAPGCTPQAPRPGRASAPPPAREPARRLGGSGRPRNRRSPSCGLRLEVQTAGTYLR